MKDHTISKFSVQQPQRKPSPWKLILRFTGDSYVPTSERRGDLHNSSASEFAKLSDTVVNGIKSGEVSFMKDVWAICLDDRN